MSTKLEMLSDRLAEHLADIARRFKPGVKLTLVVRIDPANPEAELVIGDDDPEEAIATIRRRATSPTSTETIGIVDRCPRGFYCTHQVLCPGAVR